VVEVRSSASTVERGRGIGRDTAASAHRANGCGKGPLTACSKRNHAGRADPMAKKNDKIIINRDFVFASDADLNAQIAAFQAESEKSQGQRLAMDTRRPLGAGKVRISFRVVPKR
jgi:hypothetical protein